MFYTVNLQHQCKKKLNVAGVKVWTSVCIMQVFPTRLTLEPLQRTLILCWLQQCMWTKMVLLPVIMILCNMSIYFGREWQRHATYWHKTSSAKNQNIEIIKKKNPSAFSQRIDRVHKQQIISSGLCAVMHFVAFPLTEQTKQKHCKKQDSILQSARWWPHLSM